MRTGKFATMGICRKVSSKGMAPYTLKMEKESIKGALMLKPIMAKTVLCFMGLEKFAILGISRKAKRLAVQKSGMLLGR